jgi:hypothetical protein
MDTHVWRGLPGLMLPVCTLDGELRLWLSRRMLGTSAVDRVVVGRAVAAPWHGWSCECCCLYSEPLSIGSGSQWSTAERCWAAARPGVAEMLAMRNAGIHWQLFQPCIGDEGARCTRLLHQLKGSARRRQNN